MYGSSKIAPDNILNEFANEINKLEEKEFSRYFFSHKSNCEEERSGFWDFSFHIASKIMPFIIENGKALDIGCGAGRLLIPAAGHFSAVYGCDLHSRGDLIEKRAISSGYKNVCYKQTNGRAIPYDSGMFDMIYSIYALTYSGRINVLNDIIKDSYRTLKVGGVCILYYGARSNLCRETSSSTIMLLDRLLESIPGFMSAIEQESEVNQRNLSVPKWLVHAALLREGFSIIGHGRSRRLTYPSNYAGQNYVIAKK